MKKIIGLYAVIIAAFLIFLPSKSSADIGIKAMGGIDSAWVDNNNRFSVNCGACYDKVCYYIHPNGQKSPGEDCGIFCPDPVNPTSGFGYHEAEFIDYFTPGVPESGIIIEIENAVYFDNYDAWLNYIE